METELPQFIKSILILLKFLSYKVKMAKFRTISEFQSPTHFNLVEWQKENRFHLQTAEDQCRLAERIRAESSKIQDNVVQVLEKNKLESNARFKERIVEAEFCRDEVERVRTWLQLELEPLRTIRCRLEAALRSIESCNYQITQKCRFLRYLVTVIRSRYVGRDR